VLSEGHWLFDAPLLETALERDWSAYKAIVLPDVRNISDALAEKVDSYVRAGGALIAAHRSGWADDRYEERPLPALTTLGIERVEQIRDDMRPSYLQLDADEHRLLPRLADTDLVFLDGPYCYCAYAPDVVPHMRLVPPHPYGPPERCYFDLVLDRPGYTVRRVGQGQAIHVPWLPGSLFHRQGYVNTAWFMADLLEHVAGVAPLGGNLPEQVEVTRLRSRDGFELIHLVNASGHFGVSFFAPLALQDLRVILPCAAPPLDAQSLVSGQPVPMAWAAGALALSIPRLELFEAIKLSW